MNENRNDHSRESNGHLESRAEILIRKLVHAFSILTEVEAIAVGGSRAAGETDQQSDIDLYVFGAESVPLFRRKAIVDDLGAAEKNLDLTYWDVGDEWFDRETGIEVDIIYWNPSWLEDRIAAVLDRYEASMGYSTCFWHTVLNFSILYDPEQRLTVLQEKCRQEYPGRLKQNIICKNRPLLREVIPSYCNQIQKAVLRQDLVSINHRLTEFLASYFDILFAVNKLPHPGEKKLLNFSKTHCRRLPKAFNEQITSLLGSACGSEDLLAKLNQIIDALEEIID